MVSGTAGWAGSEEFEFVIEVAIACFIADLLFQFVDRARGLDSIDSAATGADEIIAVGSRDEQGEIGGPFMEAEAPDQAMASQALQQPEDGCFVALVDESR